MKKITLTRIKKAIQRRIDRYNWYKFDHVCWLKTILYNWFWFGRKGVCKLPIWIYNNVQILTTGEIVIDGEMHSGMIKMGVWKPKANSKTRWINSSKVIFHGDTIIRGGTTIENGGLLELGKNVLLSESSRIMCMKNITLGDNVSLGFESVIMDTDFHYILNVRDMTVTENKGAIRIGAGSWVAGYCRIMKGAILPPCSIVASSSMLNADYSCEPKYTIFAGIPAKPVSTGYRRIFNVIEEWNIHLFFLSHDDKYQVETDDVDHYCTDNFSER